MEIRQPFKISLLINAKVYLKNFKDQFSNKPSKLKALHSTKCRAGARVETVHEWFNSQTKLNLSVNHGAPNNLHSHTHIECLCDARTTTSRFVVHDAREYNIKCSRPTTAGVSERERGRESALAIMVITGAMCYVCALNGAQYKLQSHRVINEASAPPVRLCQRLMVCGLKCVPRWARSLAGVVVNY